MKNKSGGGTAAIFRSLSSLEWEAKLAVVLAAFALRYEEYMYYRRHQGKDDSRVLLRSVDLLKQRPNETVEQLLNRYCIHMINDVLKVAEQLVRLREHARDLGINEISVENFAIYAYWFIRGFAFCTSFISHEQSMQFQELSTLSTEIKKRKEAFEFRLAGYHHQIACEALQQLSRTPGIGLEKIISSLINFHEDDQEPPLFDCSSGSRACSAVYIKLRHPCGRVGNCQRKVRRVAKEHKRVRYRMASNVGPNGPKVRPPKGQVGGLHRGPPIPIEAWGLNEEPVLVVLDEKRSVVRLNGLHMLHIWGNTAVPFMRERERELWEKETWSLQLLLGAIDHATLEKIKDDQLICVYGGLDEALIGEFRTKAKEFIDDERMFYVGKTKNAKLKDYLNKFNTIQAWKDLKTIHHFWARLNSMWHSYEQIQDTNTLGRNKMDPILTNVKILVGFDGHNDSWALIGTKNGSEIAQATIGVMLDHIKGLTNEVKNKLKENGGKEVGALRPPHAPHCHRFELLWNPYEALDCPTCGERMEKYTTFKCCKGGEAKEEKVKEAKA
ncbi:protein SIEVE ELEMENT OCCLUSION B-like [Malania oleifera]|uniref:protein SIEVE ELEMENT OCCLUSION B-like n=1 Tax=Malania oleifera TaxID=397392 RepID=UPI0025ADE0F3|nr:protein SIEVE ELEMENT OCCLUSION B-like [Malania oleifera]